MNYSAQALRKTGSSLSATSPKELLARLNVKEEEDRLFAIETRHGLMVMPHDPHLDRTMQMR